MDMIVLAGMPGAGKSTLLKHCLTSKFPLFGKCSEKFFSFSPIPLGLTESDTVRLIGKSYVKFVGVRKLLKDPNFIPPHKILVHVDLTHACSFRSLSYGDFCSEEFIVKQYESELKDFLKVYKKFFINTIKIDLRDVSKRFYLRERGRGNGNVDRLYMELDEVTFSLICNAWNIFVDRIASYSLETVWSEGGKFTVQEKSHI